LSADQYAPAVARYLQATAREQLLHRFITETVAERGAGAVPSRTWEQVTAATRLAAQLSTQLGLDPIGHARLQAVAGAAQVTQITIADLVEQGARTRQSAEARMVDAEGRESRLNAEARIGPGVSAGELLDLEADGEAL